LTKKSDTLDACPFPPDRSPPPKTMSTNLLEYADRFFEGWRNTLIVITIAGMMLAYSLVFSVPPLIATLAVPQAWSRIPPRPEYMRARDTPFTPAYANVTTIRSLELRDEEHLKIQNSTFIVNGAIKLSGNSKLTLLNAELYFPLIGLDTRGIGGLGEEHTTIFYDVHLSNTSRIFALNSTLSGRAPGIEILAEDETQIFFGSSNVETSTLLLQDEANLEADESVIWTVNMGSGSRCLLNDCRIVWFVPEAQSSEEAPEVVSESRAELHNTWIYYLTTQLSGSKVSLGPAILQLDGSWTSTSLAPFGEVFHIELYRCFVNNLHIIAVDSELEVTGDSALNALDLYNSKVSIRGKDMYYVYSRDGSECSVEDAVVGMAIMEGNSQAAFSGSKISSLHFIAFKGHLELDNTVVENPHLSSGDDTWISGTAVFSRNVTQGLSTGIVHSRYNVSYLVRANDGNRMLPGVKLSLSNQEGYLAWEGETDEKGECTFNVTYLKLWQPSYGSYLTDIGRESTLTASHGGEVREARIRAFETSLLIEFVFPEEPTSVFNVRSFEEPLTWVSLIIVLVILAGKMWRGG